MPRNILPRLNYEETENLNRLITSKEGESESANEAFMVRNGKIAEPVRGATLIGKGQEILKNIDMVGNDLSLSAGMCGSVSGGIPVTVGQPTIRVSSILVGGREA